MGVAGAGKSLQGKLFAKDLGYEWVSTGEIFRSHLSAERQKELLTGRLIEDSEVIELVDETLEALGKENNAVLDGFPRTMAQAEWIMDQVAKQNFKLKAVFNLVATKEIVMGRLLARGRADDNEAIIKERFNEYETKTLPIIDFFKQKGVKVYDVDASQPPETVHELMMGYIN
jgi:adenylate kinase